MLNRLEKFRRALGLRGDDCETINLDVAKPYQRRAVERMLYV